MSSETIKHFNDINSCRYLYLKEICEPEDNCLKIIIEEAVEGDEFDSLGSSGLSGRGIQVTSESRLFELFFDSYIGYSIVDESLALPDDSEVCKGRIFCVYEKSNYLDFINKSSFASEDHPGPYIHYGINCLNHIVDIASADEPQISCHKVHRSN